MDGAGDGSQTGEIHELSCVEPLNFFIACERRIYGLQRVARPSSMGDAKKWLRVEAVPLGPALPRALDDGS